MLASDEPLSETALLTIIQSLEDTRERTIRQAKGEEPSPCDPGDLADYLSQVDNTLSEIEVLYNKLRAEIPDMIPFVEVIKHNR